MICKDCIHYHDEIAELPFFKRIFSVRTMFSETCDLLEFADPVNGERMPCVTARLQRCNGEPPKFASKDCLVFRNNDAFLGGHFGPHQVFKIQHDPENKS